jgi:hypothetical protein
MDSNLERYLNDHLAGSSGAVDLIQALADADIEQRAFFVELKTKVEEDRVVLKELIECLGHTSSGILQAAGSLSEKAGRLKLLWEGLEPGRLGMFEALEVLSLGIQGKRLLWVVLRELALHIPEWEDFDFSDLEKDAIKQRDEVETRRVEAGVKALLDEERISQDPEPH